MATLSPAECAAELTPILGKSIDKAIEFKTFLDEEHEALVSADADDIQAVGREKQRCVRELETLESARARIVRLAGFDTAPEAMAEIVACLPDAGVTEAWDRYLDIARECSHLNAQNGAVINMRRSQIHHTLSLLRHGHAESDTYGPAGQSSSSLGSRPLTEA